ncbi:MAG: phosphotyrosine protein phosphatase [SAR324 cluster bacterium]|uniref:Phosphotyrosine protein phosphatase n=1 Tax=SAR324 cluster bacterium TaxID=2024889 RepID=A0A2A4SRC8_9DELT|nr:MAG: phosphotyrosine protein phosphatase [SAR324 cluster bacterium]
MKKVLFVCLGNICRSPTAEGVMKALIKQQGLEKQIFCDSAGTIGYHEGNPADARMCRHAQQRGYNLTSISRPVAADVDFRRFDLIIGMDQQNIQDLQALDQAGLFSDKIVKMTDYCRNLNVDAVPDPYYGGEQGFENVIDIIEDACNGLLAELTHGG